MRRLVFALSFVAALTLVPLDVARADTPPPVAPVGGPLEAYLARPQPSFAWTVKAEERVGGGATIYRIEFVSQTWRGLPWTHRLNVVVPAPATGERARPGHAILAITGTGGEAEHLAILAPLATRLGVPVAILHDVPNQPLFKDETEDGRGLREDALIAKTFVEYHKTGEADWPALLPMTRSAVAAMDALAQLSAERLAAGAWEHGRLEKFITTGASKRGWTTWLTAVAEPTRVIGIAPIVYDNLNVRAQITRHFEVWGHPSPQIHDYTERGLLQLFDTPRGQELLSFVDPYSYRSRLALPKLALMGTNDTYWPLDAVNLYRGDLPGDFFCHYVPNAGHRAGLSVVEAVSGFFDHVTGRIPAMPTATLTVSPRRTGLITVDAAARPRVTAARLWGTRIEGKDFTKAEWQRVDARAVDAGWEVDLPARTKEAGPGSVAFIGEVQLLDSSGTPFSVHTPVQLWELGPTQN
jgi:PhoPQ-activated pathogenicity-related protein